MSDRGTTGAPKGAVHVHEAVVAHYATAAYALDRHPGDVYWCTADPGWVTGMSYGIIAPLVHGVTVVVDEGDYEARRWYRILGEARVTVWYTASCLCCWSARTTSTPWARRWSGTRDRPTWPCAPPPTGWCPGRWTAWTWKPSSRPLDGPPGASGAGAGPHFLELRTYRFRAHSMYDPDRCREKAEIERWKTRDPIALLTDRMRDNSELHDEDLVRLGQRIDDEMLAPAIADLDPVLIFEHGGLYNVSGELPASAVPVDLDHAAVRRPGTDISLIAYGGSLPKTLAAADELAAEGISAEVIDLRTLRPLDDAAIADSVARTHRAVVIDEAWRTGSLAAEVSARIAEGSFYELDAPVERLCSAEVPMPYARQLEEAALPQTADIVAAAHRAVD